MRYAMKYLWAGSFLLALLSFSAYAAAVVEDDYTPEVTARVVRISLLRGEAQIRRNGIQDWERATLNLPLVEGDEITTDQNSRIEIQLDSWNYIRLAENSYLKLTTLRDEGVAVSLPQGTLSLRVGKFKDDTNFFEIDAPKTTVAVKKTGFYRVDSGTDRSTELMIKVADGGEARIYSDTSGFTLRNGRSARLFLEGGNAGEWETSDASRYADEFDSWSLERDAVIAKRLKDSYYDKYYDRDMYGAEDLNENGEWIFTKKYGYVWRPYRNAVSSYSDWSPYRYGEWRWVPPYGWTWINDEPWGWATYHHGRWVWDAGHWYWSPYSQYRWRRSWWRPAFVAFSWVGSMVCWYPLPYGSYYYDYNRWYYPTIINNTTIINQTTVVINPTPRPTPFPSPGVITENPSREERWANARRPPLSDVPPDGVVTVAKEDFGRNRKGIRTAPLEVGGRVIRQLPYDGETPPILPDYNEVKGKISKDIAVGNQRVTRTLPPSGTGAAERKPGAPLDGELEKKRIYGDRLPLPKTDVEPVKRDPGGTVTRRTGGIERTYPIPNDRVETPKPGTSPPYVPPQRDTGGKGDESEQKIDRRPVPKPVDRSPKDENRTPPIYVPPPTKQEERRPPTYEPPQKETAPKYDPPPRREEPKPRYDPPPRREEPKPRYDPPPRREEPKPRYDPPPRREEPKPRNDPPPRSEPPRPQPQPKSDPPPQRKPSPKSEDKPID